MNQEERRKYLIEYLENERMGDAGSDRGVRFKNRRKTGEDLFPQFSGEQRYLLRSLVNIRPVGSIDDEFLRIQDEYLREELRSKKLTDEAELIPVTDNICIWQGDITALKCDAIVNAANSGMTGCYIPNHRCIDNCIHTFAGVQLRQECGRIMAQQGRPEPVGRAKITNAYNLPCRYVLHTVGPVVEGRLTKKHREELASCYRSCLDLAEERGIESLAFCCISTGVFRFPNEIAAEIAVETVNKYKSENMKVIFNVYKDIDKQIYERILGKNIED